MKITIDPETLELKIGRKTLDELSDAQHYIVKETLNKLRLKEKMSDYEEDSMWMSYRYCIGRHTIASHGRANDIAKECYGRMSDERSAFTAYDINREIEQKIYFGVDGPEFHFPITGRNRIYTSALDIVFQFMEDYDIKNKVDLTKYKDVHVILSDNERGYKFETDLRTDFSDIDLSGKYIFMSNIQDLLVWNDLVHLFDKEHHHKSILVDGSEVEWFWTYVQGTVQKEDGKHYLDDFAYRRVRVPVKEWNGYRTTWIPDESIKEDLY